MSGLLLITVSLVLGYFLARISFKINLKKIQKSNTEALRIAYRAGFEKGIEKATNDIASKANTVTQAEQTEQTIITQQAEDLDYQMTIANNKRVAKMSSEAGTDKKKPVRKKTAKKRTIKKKGSTK